MYHENSVNPICDYLTFLDLWSYIFVIVQLFMLIKVGI